MNHRESEPSNVGYREIRARSGDFGHRIHFHAHTHASSLPRWFLIAKFRALTLIGWRGGWTASPRAERQANGPYCLGLICLICLIRSMPILLAAASLTLYLQHSTIVIHALPVPRARSRVSPVGRFRYIYSVIRMVFLSLVN